MDAITLNALQAVIDKNNGKINLIEQHLDSNSELLKSAIVIVSDCYYSKGVYSVTIKDNITQGSNVLFPHFISADEGKKRIKKCYDNITEEQKRHNSKFYAMPAIEFYNHRIEQLKQQNYEIEKRYLK